MIRNKVVVGILPTFPHSETDPYGDTASFVQMYSDKVKECGGIPIGILEKDASFYTSICDAYIWPGGSKVHREFFLILQDAIQNKKPILGICLGAQAISIFFNLLEDKKKYPDLSLEEIYQKMKEENPYLKEAENVSIHSHIVTKEKESILNAMHEITIQKNSLLYQIYQTEKMNVVSLHTITIAHASADLMISAKSSDGVIEAIEYQDFILGVQFHPEILPDLQIFEWLLETACRKYLLLVNKKEKVQKQDFLIVHYDSTIAESLGQSDMELNTKEAWLSLQAFLQSHGFIVDVNSAYRSSQVQQEIWDFYLNKYNDDYVQKYVAKPGFSEHETGLAIDVSVKVNEKWMDEETDQTAEFFTFLAQNAWQFGFIIRYPKGKEEVTGYSYEPWHIRYVGSSKIAKKIMENHLTLEEYLERKF